MSFADVLFTFTGRITAQDWWLKFFVPMLVLCGIVYTPFYLETGGIPFAPEGDLQGNRELIAMIWGGVIVFTAGLFLFTFAAASVKRLQDRGRPPGLVLAFLLLPAIGQLWAIVECSAPGQRGANAHGPDPRVI